MGPMMMAGRPVMAGTTRSPTLNVALKVAGAKMAELALPSRVQQLHQVPAGGADSGLADLAAGGLGVGRVDGHYLVDGERHGHLGW
jgi:hypothetical protein